VNWQDNFRVARDSGIIANLGRRPVSQRISHQTKELAAAHPDRSSEHAISVESFWRIMEGAAAADR
jgi:hypothetical protein